MSKMFRLVKGELSKLLLRPMVYAVVILLVGALVVTFLTFSVQNKKDTTNYYSASSLSSSQAVLQQFITTADVYGKGYSDKLVYDSLQRINFYEILASDESSTIKTKTDLTTTLIHINDTYIWHYKEYVKVGKANFTSEYAQACKNSIDLMINQFTEFRDTYSEIINYSTPVVLISQNDRQATDKLIATAFGYLKPESPYTETSSYEQFESFQAQMDGSNIISKLTDLINKLEDIQAKISLKELADAKEIILKVQTYLNNELYTKIADEAEDEKVSVDVVKEDATRYHLICKQVSSYITNLLLKLSLSGMSDGQINSLYINNSLKSSDSGDIYTYKLNEALVMDKYLLTHSPILASNDYSSALSASVSSGESVSAFDFTYYGLGICSIVLIIFSVLFGAGMVAGEQSNGTLRMLMIRPFSRHKIISSKIISTVLFGAIFILFATLILFISGAIMYDVDMTPILFVFNASVVLTMSPILYLLIFIILMILKIYIYTLISVTISVLFRSNVGAVLVSVLLYVTTTILGVACADTLWLAYLPAGNFDLFKYFGGSLVGANSVMSLSTPILHGVGMIFSVIYTIVVIGLLEFLTHYVFKKREIK